VIQYNKLVRDRIPEIIEKDQKKAKTRVLNDEEFINFLKEKLIEEAKELLLAKSIEEKIEELADIQEVLEFIIKVEKLDQFEINKMKMIKNYKKGSFDKRVFLEAVEE
jgi:predicted house-cleaning noncanonical NTP pyrophosphatase (MazG superfamily)